jgi:hypothetical protein
MSKTIAPQPNRHPQRPKSDPSQPNFDGRSIGPPAWTNLDGDVDLLAEAREDRHQPVNGEPA